MLPDDLEAVVEKLVEEVAEATTDLRKENEAFREEKKCVPHPGSS